MSDDGFINIRVVEQFYAGNGLVFNAAERVEVTTSTLWLGILLVLGLARDLVETQQSGVAASLLLSVWGAHLAVRGHLHRWPKDNGTILIPVGGMILLGVPVFWDFMTSGLETGLVFWWVGACQYILLTRSETPPRSALDPLWAPTVIGLGPLIRPDLALMSLVFGIALVLQTNFRLLPSLKAIGLAVALPLTYTAFRAGYYASLLPNTALAKSAGDSAWRKGYVYLMDFVSTYGLWIPGLAVFAILALFCAGQNRAERIAICAGATSAAIHAIYIIRVGGDFMHGRLLLPALFAVAMSVAVVPLRLESPNKGIRFPMVTTALACLVVTIWFPASALSNHSRGYATNPSGTVFDERVGYLAHVKATNDISLSTWVGHTRYVWGTALAEDLANGQSYLLDSDGQRYPRSSGVAGVIGPLGVPSLAAGTSVYVSDQHGLADPVHSRTDMGKPPHVAGHQVYPAAWRVARLSDPMPGESHDVALAREALKCAPLRELQAAVSDPLTPDRFLRNMILAPQLTFLRIPESPNVAVRVLC